MTNDTTSPQNDTQVTLEDAAKTMYRRLARMVYAQDRATMAQVRRLAGRGSDDVVLRAMLLAIVPPAPPGTDSRIWQESCLAAATAFCVFHAGAATPNIGSGSLGAALRRLSEASGGGGPVAVSIDRMFQALAGSHDRLVIANRLISVVRRLDGSRLAPPYWPQLVIDLVRWRPGNGEVTGQWAVDLYAPQHSGKPTKETTSNP